MHLPDQRPSESENLRLAAWVKNCLLAFRRASGPLLGAAFDAFLASRGLSIESHPLANFTRIAQPVVHLPVWIAAALARHRRPATPAAVIAAIESAATGYLCAQVQDAIVDGTGEVAVDRMLLAHALFARHQSALASVTSHPEFWRFFDEKWRAYAEALALERKLQRGTHPIDAAAFDRILDRSRPLVLPAAALLAHAGNWERALALDELVRHTTRAAQLTDDAADAERDLKSGNLTYVVRRMNGDRGLPALLSRLFFEGGFDQILREAMTDLDAAAAIATRADLLEARHGIDEARRRVDELRRKKLDAWQGVAERIVPGFGRTASAAPRESEEAP